LTWTFRGYLIWYCGGVILCSPSWDLQFLKNISLYLFSVSIWCLWRQIELYPKLSLFWPIWSTGGLIFWHLTLRHVIVKMAYCKSFHTYHFSLFRTCDLSSEIILFVKNKCVPRLQAQSCEMICKKTSENVMFQSTARRS